MHVFRELDLSEWKYCKIIATEKQNYGVIVTVEEISRGNISSSARCLIRGHWYVFSELFAMQRASESRNSRLGANAASKSQT